MPLPPRATSSSGSSPAPTPPPAGPAARALPGARPRRRARRARAHPDARKDPDFLEALAGSRPTPAPSSPTATSSRRRRSRSRARLDQPALLAAAGLARGRSGAARDHGRRRGHRCVDLPHRAGPRHRARPRRDDRDHPSEPTPRATCSTGCRLPGPSCSSPRSTVSSPATSSPCRSRSEGVSLAPKIEVEDARIIWSRPATAVERLVRGCTPAPGAWTTFRGERLKVSPVTVVSAGDVGGRREPVAAGDLRVTKKAVFVGTGTGPGPPWARCGARQEADGGGRLGAGHTDRGGGAGRR